MSQLRFCGVFTSFVVGRSMVSFSRVPERGLEFRHALLWKDSCPSEFLDSFWTQILAGLPAEPAYASIVIQSSRVKTRYRTRGLSRLQLHARSRGLSRPCKAKNKSKDGPKRRCACQLQSPVGAQQAIMADAWHSVLGYKIQEGQACSGLP